MINKITHRENYTIKMFGEDMSALKDKEPYKTSYKIYLKEKERERWYRTYKTSYNIEININRQTD